ncbi:MAG TPA: glycosyltransferase family 39 protein [Bryobacteraceae bacterium]|nr:glycosyltransferase family 39 protein [Bryobacteraceae bacterium]
MKLTVPHANAGAALLCMLFVLSGSLFLDRPGLHSDELLFAGGIYPPAPPYGSARVFGRDFPLMVMSYCGTLKSLLWTPIFAAFGVTAVSVRFPALLIGALSVWWFYRLLLATLGTRIAVIGCALLATHSTYLFTTRWDWGPVALQHALFTGGCLAFVHHWRSRSPWWAAAGGFAFGLGLWDKALFAWSIAAVVLAVTIAFPRQLWRSLSIAGIVFAIAGLVAGAYPLLRYNVRHNWETFRGNTEANTESVAYKFSVLRATVDASVVGGPVIRPRHEGPERYPASSAEHAVDRLAKLFRYSRDNLHGWLLLGCLLMTPLWWRTPARRAVLFTLCFCAALWAQMVPLQYGGSSSHHTILLWPVALVAPAAVLGHVPGASWITAALCVQSLGVTAVWYSELLRLGGVPAWTEAIGPAAASLREHRGRVCVLDWGFFDNLRALGQGRYTMCVLEDPVQAERQRYVLHGIADPSAIFIRHTDGHEIDQGRAARTLDFAQQHGYVQTERKLFEDANGRATIETFRLTKLQ